MSEDKHQKKTRARHDGSIFQRKDGRWVAELDFGVIEGKRYRPARYTDSQKEAREELQKLLKQRETGAGRITPERLTVSDYLDSWLQTMQQRVGVKTHRTYGDFVRMHVKPHICDLRLTKLRPDDVRGLMRTLLSKGLSAASVRHVRACLRCALNDAIKDSVLQTNATERAEPPKVARPQLKVLNGNEAAKLLDAARVLGWSRF